MHIIVCLKQVPDTTDVRIDPKTNTLIREGVPSIANPFDISGVEAALSLRDSHSVKITVISMGPPQAKEALRKAIAMGADQAILLSDRVFAGADTLATSYTLSQAILKIKDIEGLDLVICGKQAIDGDTAQVGPGIATRLGLTQLSYVSKIRKVDLENHNILVERKLEEGIEIIEGRLPALLTVVKEINKPRYATLPNLIKSVSYEPLVWEKEDLILDLARTGLDGSPTVVEKTFTPSLRGGGEVINAGDDGFENKLDTMVSGLKMKITENRKIVCA
ncbi:MAG: electron transfer flavoprotein subunit beta/FixA family protein [Candidatus Margulisiibacteriota bacterium]